MPDVAPVPITIGVRLERRGGHTTVHVWIGPRRGSRGKAGELVVRNEEVAELLGRLNAEDVADAE